MGIALVTGTSTGIGLATAITLARAGHTVWAGMRNLGRGSALRETVAKEQLPVTVVELDVDSDASVEAVFSKLLADQGRIDVLVNNAGIGGGGPAELIPLSLFRQIMETNYFGSLRCIKAVLPLDAPAQQRLHRQCNIDSGTVRLRHAIGLCRL